MRIQSAPPSNETCELVLPVEHRGDSITNARIETFAAPDGLEEVLVAGTELVCRCPLTQQTDVYESSFAYRPTANGRCVETK